MKILIISQNTYPSHGPRSFRTQELSEQLAKMGHEVVLYTIHGTCTYEKYEKKTGIRMRNIDIPSFFPLVGNDGVSHYNFFKRALFHFFHRPLLYPEIELYFKVDSIIRKEKDVDLLITIAFPFTIHFGATRSKKKHRESFPKVWLADCGDPFFLNPFMTLPKYMEKYEREWSENVDYIIVPTENSKDGYFQEYREKIRVIPQGFDFSKTPIATYKKNEVPTFVFAGSIFPGIRDPHSFMDYLLTLKEPYKFIMFMRTPLEPKYEKESNGQIEYVIGKGRKEVVWGCSKADFLINVTNPSSVQTPSKLIDYGISQRPVLDIANDFKDDSVFKEFMLGDYSKSHVIESLDSYRIENVANSFLKLAE